MEPRVELKFLDDWEKQNKTGIGVKRGDVVWGLPPALLALEIGLATGACKRLGGPSPRAAAGRGRAEVSAGRPGPRPLSPRPARARPRCAAANSPILVRALLLHLDGLVQLAVGGAGLRVGSLHAGGAGTGGAAGGEELTAAAPLRARLLALRSH